MSSLRVADPMCAQDAQAVEDFIDLSSIAPAPIDRRLRRLLADAEYCATLAHRFADPRAKRMLLAVADALWGLSDEGTYTVVDDYRIQPVLAAFFHAVEQGTVPVVLIRRLANVIRACARAVRTADTNIDKHRRTCRRVARELRQAGGPLRTKSFEMRRRQPSLGCDSSRVLVATLTLAPSAPPRIVEF